MTNNAAAPTGELLQFDPEKSADQGAGGHRPISHEPVRPARSETAISRLRGPAEGHRPVPTVIVHKSPLFRAGLIHMLADTRFLVVVDCPELSMLEETVLSDGPALLLVDPDTEADAVLAEVSRLKESHSLLRVVLLRNRFSSREILMAIGSGADCCLVNDEISADLLLKSLELALLGAVIVPRGLCQALADGCPSMAMEGGAHTDRDAPAAELAAQLPADRLQMPAGLSGRELTILSYLMQGASNKHIARDLGIAEATVKVHVKSLLRKIRVRNRTQAAMWGTNHIEATRPCRNGEDPGPQPPGR